MKLPSLVCKLLTEHTVPAVRHARCPLQRMHSCCSCRQGNFDKVLPYLDDPRYLTGLPASARAAARKLLLSQPVFCNVSSWTKCSQLHGPRVVLLGDAGHTISPVLGERTCLHMLWPVLVVCCWTAAAIMRLLLQVQCGQSLPMYIA